MRNDNLPRLRSRESYIAAAASATRQLLASDSVVSVYAAGTVRHPGISDLDLLVVLRDDLTSYQRIENDLPYAARDMIGTGSLLKVPAAAAADLKIIDDFTLKHLGGELVAFREYTSRWYEICRILDWLPERLTALARIRSGERRDITHSLQVLKSTAVSLVKIDRCTGVVQWETAETAVAGLRSRWFELSEAEQLRQLEGLVDDTISAGCAALDFFAGWLSDEGVIVPQDINKSRQRQFVISGGPRWDFGAATMVEGESVTVPWVVLPFLSVQAQASPGFISQGLVTALGDSVDVSASYVAEPLRMVIRKRMDYVQKVADYFRANGITSGLMKYGWFLEYA